METMHWALSLLQRESENQTFGNVSFSFKNGKITNAKVERSEMPSIDKKADQP